MCSAPVVPCRNPCPCGFRLAALSVDGASQNVQVARRPSVCRGNWLPVALFPGKRTLLAPSITRTARLFDASAAEESGWLHIRDYLLVKLRRFRRITCSFFFFFATPALNKTADWCMIGEEPLGVITKKRTYACKSKGTAHERRFYNCLYRISWHAPYGETIPVRCPETVLKCRGTCSLMHPRGLSAHRLQHWFWRGCRAGNRPGKGSRKASVCG